MSATTWAAWLGASSGLGSLIWNIYSKFSSRHKLRVTARAGLVKMPSPPGNPHYLQIKVQHIGSVPLQISNVGFYRFDSWYQRFRRKRPSFSAVLNQYEGPPYPRLEVGAEWMALMEQTQDFDNLLEGSNPMYVAIIHSFSRHPTYEKVLNPGHPPKR